jgi:predicted nucleotide-binding protein
MIVSVLSSKGAVAGRDVKARDLLKASGLSDGDFDAADTYLFQAGYVEGTMGGLDGSRWLTPAGIESYHRTVESKQSSQNRDEGGVVESQDQPDAKKVFVVHGRNDDARRAMFSFLRSIRLHPIDWSEATSSTGEGAPYVGQILDKAFGTARAVVILLTGDDLAYLRQRYWQNENEPHEVQPTPQARPNVLFEAGMAFGRDSKRTILVELGSTRPFSDIAGRHVVRLSNDTRRRNELVQRLRTAGCEVDTTSSDWHDEGDFEGAVHPVDKNESSKPSMASGIESVSSDASESNYGLAFERAKNPRIHEDALDPSATYWTFDPVTFFNTPGHGNLNLDIQLGIQSSPGEWLSFQRVPDRDGLADPIVIEPDTAVKGRLAFRVPHRDLQGPIETGPPNYDVTCALFIRDIGTGQLIEEDNFSMTLVELHLKVEGFNSALRSGKSV